MSESNREPLDVAATQARSGDRWTVRAVAETGSTNADLLAATDLPDRTVLVAELQTGGRGRLARSWVSPASAGLTFSVLVRPGVAQPVWGWLPLLAGLALARAIGPAAGLKWPNDVLLGPDEGKVAGILAQSGAAGTTAVIGVGLNVSTTVDELPVPTATSLQLQGHSQLDRAALLVDFLAAFDELYDGWQAAGGDAERSGLAAGYRAGCSSIGREVTVQLAERSVQGTVTAVDPAGRLVLAESGSGDELVLAAGDVTHVRPISR